MSDRSHSGACKEARGGLAACLLLTLAWAVLAAAKLIDDHAFRRWLQSWLVETPASAALVSRVVVAVESALAVLGGLSIPYRQLRVPFSIACWAAGLAILCVALLVPGQQSCGCAGSLFGIGRRERILFAGFVQLVAWWLYAASRSRRAARTHEGSS